MHIAIEGCAHGELETIYKCVHELEVENKIKIELLICCGDFQSVRNENDLVCMAVPPKYYNMCSFHKYYSGELTAPVLTIFIGGNHEASNYLQELPFGGWVAPNIYYLGYAGVVNYRGLRIGGISGIFKHKDYNRGHFESSPYREDTKRSVYHIRNVEVFRLKQLSDKMDIFLSHDWPTEITNYGNVNQLLKFKPYFKGDIDQGRLGSPPCKELLLALRPKYWFAAHLHCKFTAIVPHDDNSHTKFLALDKCLPHKRFLQVIDIQIEENISEVDTDLKYDLEWLTILHLTPHLFSTKAVTQYMPSKTGVGRWNFTPTDAEKNKILEMFENDLNVPKNFSTNAPCYQPQRGIRENIYQPNLQINNQTTELCAKLKIVDPTCELVKEDETLNASENYNPDSETPAMQETDSSEIPVMPIKRKSLVLPEAINKYDEPIDLILNKTSDCEPVTDETSSNMSKPNTEISNDLEDIDNTEKPCIKKFKRRNAIIYEQDET